MLKKGLAFGCGAVVLGAIAVLLLIQLIPYGKNHSNPPVGQEPQWPDAQTRALAKRACFDCHSNETIWPLYSNIAPVSWLVQRDVDEGRSVFNFSEWNGVIKRERGGDREAAEELVDVVQEGEMPPAIYLVQHPEAKLTDAEKQQLMQGLQVLR